MHGEVTGRSRGDRVLAAEIAELPPSAARLGALLDEAKLLLAEGLTLSREGAVPIIRLEERLADL